MPMPHPPQSLKVNPSMIENVASRPAQPSLQSGGLQVDRTKRMNRMDRMYRYSRHIYDLSRALYLPGRDAAIKQAAQRLPARGTLLEVGCGTGRNLRHLRQHRPDARLFGLDAASVMLRTARRACHEAGVHATLRHGMAEDVHPSHFGVQGFDVILCSYLFSMIAAPRPALCAALRALRPGGYLIVVDFGTAAALPPPLRELLRRWLRLFGVAHRPSVGGYLHRQRTVGALEIIQERHLRGQYAELRVCQTYA